MFLLVLQLPQSQQVLKFKANKDAAREFETILKAIGPSDGLSGSTFLLIEDDYGHKLASFAHYIQNAVLMDVNADFAGQAEMAVLQARGQAQVNRAVQADPGLRLTAGMEGGRLLSS